MLPRAVVVEGARLLVPVGERASRLLPHRGVRAAVKVVHREAAPLEEPPDRPDVERLAPVRRGRQGDLLRREAEAALAPGREKRRELERLGRRAKEDGLERVAGRREKPAVGGHDRDGSPVDRFDPRPAGHDEKRHGLREARGARMSGMVTAQAYRKDDFVH